MKQPQLDDAALFALARAHAASTPIDWRGHAPQRVEAVKVCELSDPPGVYYHLDFPDASDDGVLLGGGGFFIFARDGAIVEFGSGEPVAATLGMRNVVALSTQELVRRMLARRGAT